MLIQVITNHPEAISTIFKNTPTWVWGLLTGLIILGLTQIRDREASLVRVAIMPVAMTAFSIYGTMSAFSKSPNGLTLAAAWIAAAVLVFMLISRGRAAGTYNAAKRTFQLPGSFIPMALIMGIFLTKYWVGIELGMQPNLTHDTVFTLGFAGLYGAFSGLFVGRTARLWRMVAAGAQTADANPGVIHAAHA